MFFSRQMRLIFTLYSFLFSSAQTMDRFDDTRDEKYKAQMALMQQLHMKAE